MLKSYLTEAVIDAVDAVDAELRATWRVRPAEWPAPRRGLFRFLGNKRIKVSLLLHEKLQLEDGRVRLPVSEPETRSRSVVGPVGTTRRHDIAGSEQKRTFHSAFSFDDARDAEKRFAGAPSPEIPPGGNMYSRDLQAPEPPAPIGGVRAGRQSSSRSAPRDAGNVRQNAGAGRIGWRRGGESLEGSRRECARRVDPRVDERARRVRGASDETRSS